MSKSIQDQLLGSGLVDGKKAKKISKEKRKEKNEKRRNKESMVSEAQVNAQKALEEKKTRDRELNLARQVEADKIALAAQVKQLTKQYRLKNTSGDEVYNFSDDGIVKRLYIKRNILEEIIRGRLCIVKIDESYELIPKPVADKIRERSEDCVLVYTQKAEKISEGSSKDSSEEASDADSDEAYYAQFEIPDDLSW